jgi:hypothetical protein
VKPTKDKNDLEESMALFENKLSVIPYSPLIGGYSTERNEMDKNNERLKKVKKERNQIALEKVFITFFRLFCFFSFYNRKFNVSFTRLEKASR